MPILITNIRTNLVKQAIKLTKAEKIILILSQEFESDIQSPYQLEYLDYLDPEKTSSHIRDIFVQALQEDEVELALEANALGLQILESAKDYEIFKKKNIFIAKNGKIDTFKACLC